MNPANTRQTLFWILALIPLSFLNPTSGQSGILHVNYEKLVSRADLHYTRQVAISEEGLPIGNGTMGSLLWTTPKQLRLQINRVDVFAVDRTTNSFPEVDTDYSSGCAFFDLDFEDFGPDVFPPDHTIQHLSVYDGVAKITGNQVDVEVFAWPQEDVFVLKITDNREEPASIRASLRTLRPVNYRHRNHYAFTRIKSDAGRILLGQQFMEGEFKESRWMESDVQDASKITHRTFYCASSVGVSVLGRESQVNQLNDGTIQLAASPGKGTFYILISSAAGFNKDQDVNEVAVNKLQMAEKLGYTELSTTSKNWWHTFWSNSFIHLSSKDGVAEYVEKHYTYFQYLMASCSRGSYPPRYGGMIWNTAGDDRMWGSMKWMYNLFCYYNNVLLAANKIELTYPVIQMFHINYHAMELSAEQQWGSKGINIPETMWFNGPDSLPPDIADEMKDLYLVRKPWSEASERFLQYASNKHAFEGRWSWKDFDGYWKNGHLEYKARPSAPFSYVTHLFASGAKIAFYHWMRYDYTQDKEWLKIYGYPIIKGVTEFYRNYPNVKKEADGKYHIYGVNNWESAWGSSNTLEELTGMKAITATAIRASEILGIDRDMRHIWQEFHDNISDLPTIEDTSRKNNPRIWVNTVHPAFEGTIEGRDRINVRRITPCTNYDFFTLETTDREMINIANNTYAPQRQKGNPRVGWLSKAAVTAATMGDSEQVKMLVPGQIKYQGLEQGHPQMGAGWGSNWVGPLGNRLSLAEGRQAMGAQRIGNALEGLVLALCRGTPPGPAGKTVIQVFPAWPKEWDVAFTLLTRGNFLVTSSMQNGTIEFVEILSQSGNECRVRNPWGENTALTLYKNHNKWKDMEGSLISFATKKGKNYLLVPVGIEPGTYKRTILE